MERQLGKSTLEDDARRLLTWVREQAGGLTHNIRSATHPDTIAGPVTRGQLLVGESTPKWTGLALGAAYTHLESDGTDLAYQANLTMADDAWIGLGAAAGRIIFDSTTNPDQAQLAAADLYLPASHGIIHADGVTAGYVLRADGTRYVPADPTATVPLAPVAQNDMIIANATPAWSILTGPSAQHQRLSSGASPFVPAWTLNLEMADDAWIGLGAAAARLVFDSTPAVDEIRLVSGVLDLNGIADALVLDSDGDTSISAPTDDRIDIEIAGADDFTFTANSFNVLASSYITMADDAWIGLGAAAGRLVFDSTPAPDQVELTAADLYIATSAHGIIHVDGVTAGYVLRADGTRYVPADPTLTVPLAPVAQGDLLIADGTPAWSILTLGAAAGYALVSTATTAVWDQTPVWTGDHTWDDGSGDSPAIKFVGGSNDDTASIFLDDDATAGDSDLAVKLVDADGDSRLKIQDSGGTEVLGIDSNGVLHLTDGGSSEGTMWWETTVQDGVFVQHVTNNQPGFVITTPKGTAAVTQSGFYAYGTDVVADSTNTEYVSLLTTSDFGWLSTQKSGTGTLNPLLLTVGPVATQGIRIETGPKIFMGNDTNTFVTQGLTINQATYDDEILALKSSTDVNHPMTAIAEKDTYGTFTKAEGSAGGLVATGYKDSAGVAGFALGLAGRLGEAADTTKTTAAYGVVTMDASVTDGGTGIQAVGADGNLFVIRNHSIARYIFDAEGSAHADVEWTTFDEYDDLALLADLETALTNPDPVHAQFAEFLKYSRDDLERSGIVCFDDENPGHAMVNFTRLSMLIVGALRQIYLLSA